MFSSKSTRVFLNMKDIAENVEERFRKLDINAILQIVRSAGKNDIPFLDIGIREFEVFPLATADMPGYEDLYPLGDVVVNGKTKMIAEKGNKNSILMREADAVYEVIIPFNKEWNWVSKICVFASARCNGENESTLKYYTFLLAKSVFDNDDFLKSVHMDNEPKRSKFFPTNVHVLEQVGRCNYDVMISEQTSHKNRKDKYDICVRNEITLDEQLETRSVHPEKISRKTFLISDLIRNIK